MRSGETAPPWPRSSSSRRPSPSRASRPSGTPARTVSVGAADLATVIIFCNFRALDINCTDPLGRTALSIAIINENPELMEILLEAGIQTRDSLLLAIDEQVGGAQLYSQT